jgi:hypothetical protein
LGVEELILSIPCTQFGEANHAATATEHGSPRQKGIWICMWNCFRSIRKEITLPVT